MANAERKAPTSHAGSEPIEVLEQLLEGSGLLELLPAEDVAFGIVAAYFGVDMLGQLQGDLSRSKSLLDLTARWAELADPLLPTSTAEHR